MVAAEREVQQDMVDGKVRNDYNANKMLRLEHNSFDNLLFSRQEKRVWKSKRKGNGLEIIAIHKPREKKNVVTLNNKKYA